jgi:hypothetical protein
LLVCLSRASGTGSAGIGILQAVGWFVRSRL